MVITKNLEKNAKKSFNTDHNFSEHIIEESTSELSIRKYKNDEDFDEAFKNLLRPIESIAKKNQCEPLQYDLLKELDSYLNHLRETSDGGSTVFVEAALMIQNVILIYQKRVDQLFDVMMKLIGKFRAYRINPNQNDDVGDDAENLEGNKKKKKEKKIKFYSSFESIKGQTFGTLKMFDCKIINLSKKAPVSKIVLNANIKVKNKYCQILPYILIGNGENIGKKYDYMLNCPLNRDLAVHEEFDCTTNEDQRSGTTLKYRKSTDPLPMNLMDVDSDDILPSTPDPVIFDQTVTDGVFCAKEGSPQREIVLNVSQIPNNMNNDDNIDDGAWATVLNTDNFIDKPITKKKNLTKEDNAMWLPTYTIGELCGEMLRLKSGISVDPVFRQLIHKVQEAQRSEIAKKRNKRIIDEEKKRFDYYDVEMDERLKNGEEPGFKGFDCPVYNDNFDDNCFEDLNDQNGGALDVNNENFQSYQNNVKEMEKHEQNQIEIMNEQLEMRKRVQAWHDNLRPKLEEEEKRTKFDIHEYGTRVLNCFKSIGEKKSFKDIVGGLQQEEVARYFLSTLMMANTYNLKIIKSDGETIIELLKKERHHEELQVNIGNQVNQEFH